MQAAGAALGQASLLPDNSTQSYQHAFYATPQQVAVHEQEMHMKSPVVSTLSRQLEQQAWAMMGF